MLHAATPLMRFEEFNFHGQGLDDDQLEFDDNITNMQLNEPKL